MTAPISSTALRKLACLPRSAAPGLCAALFVLATLCGPRSVLAEADLPDPAVVPLPSVEELGEGDPERAARLEAIASELRAVAERYGPDVVILQTHLLMKALEAGAVLPVEVRVAGEVVGSAQDAQEPLLGIEVDTGLLFDATTGSAAERRSQVEAEVVLASLTQMRSFNMKPAGLRLVVSFKTQDPSEFSDSKLDPTEAAAVVTESFEFLPAQLSELSAP